MPTSRTLSGGKYRSCASIYNKAAKFFNKKLSSELYSLRFRNPPVKVVFADIYTPMLEIIKNPQSYGNLPSDVVDFFYVVCSYFNFNFTTILFINNIV